MKRKNNPENIRRIRQRFPSLFGHYSPLVVDLPLIDTFETMDTERFPHLARTFTRSKWWEAREKKTSTRKMCIYLVDKYGIWHCPQAQTDFPPFHPERLIQLIERQKDPKVFCQTLTALVACDTKTHIMGEPIEYNVGIFPLHLKGLPNATKKSR